MTSSIFLKHVDKNGKRVLNPAKQWLPKSNFFFMNTWHKNTKVLAGVICISKGSKQDLQNLNALSLHTIVFVSNELLLASLLTAAKS